MQELEMRIIVRQINSQWHVLAVKEHQAHIPDIRVVLKQNLGVDCQTLLKSVEHSTSWQSCCPTTSSNKLHRSYLHTDDKCELWNSAVSVRHHSYWHFVARALFNRWFIIPPIISYTWFLYYVSFYMSRIMDNGQPFPLYVMWILWFCNTHIIGVKPSVLLCGRGNTPDHLLQH